VAGYFSVYGIGLIFSGSFIAATIMGGTLEIGKIVAVSWLYRNFKQCSLTLKIYLLGAIVVLSLITSLGIFGFLSRAHLEQSILINNGAKSQIELIQTKIAQQKETIDSLDKQIGLINNALQKMIDSNRAASSVRIGDDQQRNRTKLNTERNKTQAIINDLELQKVKLENENRKSELDVGPILYVAETIFGKSDQGTVDKTVRFLIIIIMFVFDPLAIALIVAANQGLLQNKEWTEQRSSLTILDNPDILKINKNNVKEIL
jgi:hypothetical protein